MIENDIKLFGISLNSRFKAVINDFVNVKNKSRTNLGYVISSYINPKPIWRYTLCHQLDIYKRTRAELLKAFQRQVNRYLFIACSSGGAPSSNLMIWRNTSYFTGHGPSSKLTSLSLMSLRWYPRLADYWVILLHIITQQLLGIQSEWSKLVCIC